MIRTFIFLLIAASLFGCSKEKTEQASTAAKPAAAKAAQAAKAMDAAPLMQAVFAEAYRSATKDAVAELPDPDNRAQRASYVVTPVAATTLDNGEAVLVANAEQADDQGNAMSGHASSGLLNVYFLRQDGKRWKLLRRQENIAALGSSGNIGEAKWIKLAEGKPGLAMLHGGTWQGYTVEVLSLFDLGAAQMHDLTGDGIKLHSDSDGACVPESDKCWDVSGEWHFVSIKSGGEYDDLVIEFSGEESVASKAGSAARKVKQIRDAARYAYDGKRYRLVSGRNIVPEV
jgi:hypothetical protein